MDAIQSEIQSKQIWFIAGSQHLYGEASLNKVAEHVEAVVEGLNRSRQLPLPVISRSQVSTSEDILSLCVEANQDSNCVGVIFWMHTFAPAKWWARGLQNLSKPFMHFHTQFFRDIPYESIDMDYMNLHQSAHGDREFGFLNARMRNDPKVVVGHWQDEEAQFEIGEWCRVALAWQDWQGARFARFGDNMRGVAVTEGDKLQAQLDLGFDVLGFGISDLQKAIEACDQNQVEQTMQWVRENYDTSALKKESPKWDAVRASLEMELGIENFLKEHQCKGFTDTFENLGDLKQLPGLPVQHLMQKGYGFGAEGDWKLCALLRAIKVMSYGSVGGSSFMEDYTYHLKSGEELVLGAHMLEVCPSIISKEEKPRLEVHPLSIGGKSDPARLVFNGEEGLAYVISMVDMGSRFRMIVQEVESLYPGHEMPKLPTARVTWKPKPNFKTAAKAWILSGGGHHSVYTQGVSLSQLQDFAGLAGMEIVSIGKDTRIETFQKELRWNDLYYHLNRGLR